MEACRKPASEALDATLDHADILSNCAEPLDSFDALGLTGDLLRGIYTQGFVKPSAFMQKCVSALIGGRDIICESDSGASKTAAIAIGVLQRVHASMEQLLIPCHLACAAMRFGPQRSRQLPLPPPRYTQLQFLPRQLQRFLRGCVLATARALVALPASASDALWRCSECIFLRVMSGFVARTKVQLSSKRTHGLMKVALTHCAANKEKLPGSHSSTRPPTCRRHRQTSQLARRIHADAVRRLPKA